MTDTAESPLPSAWNLPQAIKIRVGATVGRQRAMIADGHLLLLMHAVPSGNDHDHRQGVLVWRMPGGTWKGTERGSGPDLVHSLLDSYDAAVNALELQVEQADNVHDWFEVIQRIGPLHRAARNLHATLQSARTGLPKVRPLIVLRDAAEVPERQSSRLAQCSSRSRPSTSQAFSTS